VLRYIIPLAQFALLFLLTVSRANVRVQAIHADIMPDTAVLWVANRKLNNEKTLAAEVGRNDKTRVTVTIQHAKEPAPPQSVVSC
jgi:Cilia- and flagella-associated protein 298